MNTMRRPCSVHRLYGSRRAHLTRLAAQSYGYGGAGYVAPGRAALRAST